MPNCHITNERVKVLFPENLCNQTHLGMDINAVAVRGGYTCALLTAVLKCKQTKERETTSLLAWHMNRYNSTFLFGVVIRSISARLATLVSHGAILNRLLGVVNAIYRAVKPDLFVLVKCLLQLFDN